MNVWERTQRAIGAHEALSTTEARAYQLRKVREILEHHRQHSPRYQELLLDSGLDATWSLDSMDHLASLPTVDKSFLRTARFSESPSTSEPVTIVSTSGTTSAATEIPHNESSLRSGLGENFARAIVLGGLTHERWCLVGHWDPSSAEANVSVTGSYLSMAWLANELRQAPLLRNGASGTDRLVTDVCRYGPEAIASSPNLLAAVARGILARGSLLPLRGLIYGGAAATDGHRALWDEVFQPSRVVGFYPTTDAGALGVSVEDDGRFVTFSETHLVEVVDLEGRHVSVGERGRVAVTAYESRAAPIIRYLVGDEVTYEGMQGPRVVVSAIARVAEAAIGDTLLPMSSVEEWTARLTADGHLFESLQLVLRRDGLGRDQPILRLHNVSSPREAARKAAVDVYMSVGQLATEVREGAVAEPMAEVVDRHADRGFKLPPFLDER